MKTDRELLQLAAKTIGLELEGDLYGNPGPWMPMYYQGKTYHPWNPLKDDGDALRLANELELNIFHSRGNAYAMESESDQSDEQIVSHRNCKDKNEAMRRAIVRVAAEIGKAMT